jgi:N-acetylneuraminic acid mutarotase
MKSALITMMAMTPLLLAGCSTTPGAGPAGPPPTSPTSGGSNQWTWVSGANSLNPSGSYGTKGAAGSGNVPSGRLGAVGWTDGEGNLWLFGGESAPVGGSCGEFNGVCTSGTNEWYNDLWKFDGSEWTWMGGSNTTDQPGIYGTKGVGAAGKAPGARYSAASWTDGSGNFWVFGGQGYDSQGNTGLLNDLWKFDGKQWTWVGGSNVINQPGVYGTQGQGAAGNSPGARYEAVGRVDLAGNFLLFGGQGCDSTIDCGGALSDVWKFSGGQWTWVNGSSVTYPTQAGVYGIQGTPSGANTPGGRWSSSGWVDGSGNLLIFGGVGWGGSTQNVAELNDLWSFGGGQWTWIGGSSEIYPAQDVLGTYGTLGVAAPGNLPGSRDSGMSWTDAAGNLWFFGGEGFGATNSGYLFNDLWKYSGGQWTWVGGSSAGMQDGVYGTVGVADAGNDPGSRIDAVTWTDAEGHLWMFGGLGFGATGTSTGFLNDLWEYQP